MIYEDYKVIYLEKDYFYEIPYHSDNSHYAIGLKTEYAPDVFNKKRNTILKFINGTTASIFEKSKFINESIASSKRFTDLLYEPKEGEVLYFDKSCKIPRAKCADKFKRTIKLEKADCVVVPDNIIATLHKNFIIFADDKKKIMYVLRGMDKAHYPTIGQSFKEYHDSLKYIIHQNNLSNQANILLVEKIKDSKCIGADDLVNAGLYFFNILEGVYKKIVPESKLLKVIDGDEEQHLTIDILEGLIPLINGKDGASVHQGLRILAEMDYMSNKNIVSYLLRVSRNNWAKFHPFNTSVKFMLKTLKNHISDPNILNSIGKDEFERMEGLYTKLMKEQIQQKIKEVSSKTNLIIDTDINIKLRHTEI